MLFVVLIWTYLPTWRELTTTWSREADYSHGYFVMPLAAYFLWHRRQSFPGAVGKPSWLGFVVVLASASLCVLGGYLFLEAVQSWSLLLWLAGVTWFLGGRRMLLWAMPSIVFLVFMIPLPFRIEQLLTLPLQSMATRISCWLLQCLGQPAIAEGNVIVLGDVRLAVAEACSGLRIFVSVVALAFVAALLTSKPWWTKASLFVLVLPITLVSNALRIAATGLLHVYVSEDVARHFGHDVAGWLMIVLAASLMAVWLWYLNLLVFPVQTVTTRELLDTANLA